MNKIVKPGLALFGAVFLTLFIATSLNAQCPMCRMSAESNLANGGTDGLGLNAGILYMLAMPYLLVGAIGFWWWRNRKHQRATTEAEIPGVLDEDPSRYN